MTKLETLYASIKGLEKVGLTLTDEMLKKADELEEQLIKTEVLPTLSKDIEPRLSQIQRELVLVVEYKPGEPISVALSRKSNIAELLEAKRLEPDPQVSTRCLDHAQRNRKRKLLALGCAFFVETGPSYKNTMLLPPLLLPLWRLTLFVFVNLVLNIAALTLYRPPKIRSMVMLSVK